MFINVLLNFLKKLKMKIGEVIKKLREDAKLTQKELATQILKKGIYTNKTILSLANAIGELENEITINTPFIKTLANFFGIPEEVIYIRAIDHTKNFNIVKEELLDKWERINTYQNYHG